MDSWKFGDLDIGRSRAAFALVNSRRKEGMFSTNNEGGDRMRDGLFDFSWAKIQFSTDQTTTKLTPEEWSEWLKDAELVRFQFVEEKRVMTDELVVPLTYR
jgi:hypothetical protein